MLPWKAPGSKIGDWKPLPCGKDSTPAELCEIDGLGENGSAKASAGVATYGNPVDVVMVGDMPNYVVEDAGFRRHVESKAVDLQVIEMLREQFMAHREVATEAMLQWMGKDDLFTKAMIDASIRNMDQVL